MFRSKRPPRQGLSSMVRTMPRHKGRVAVGIAVWSAVGRWQIETSPDHRPNFAVAEMLAARRRHMAGRPTKVIRDYFSLKSKAEAIRAAWYKAGRPGFGCAVNRTFKDFNLKSKEYTA